MIKSYLVVAYGVLAKAEKWLLEPIEGEDKPVVPEDYRIAVAEYLATVQ